MAQGTCHVHLGLTGGEKPLIHTSNMEAMMATQYAQQIVSLIVFAANPACRTVPHPASHLLMDASNSSFTYEKRRKGHA